MIKRKKGNRRKKTHQQCEKLHGSHTHSESTCVFSVIHDICIIRISLCGHCQMIWNAYGCLSGIHRITLKFKVHIDRES